MATITILRERALAQTTELAAQLQAALSSRVVLEQAKGVLAERIGLSVDDAFRVLRRYARDHNQRLDDVSRAVIDNTVDAAAMLGSAVLIEPGRTAAD
jgi:AmiR/NasT family two-component response regulator